MTVLIKTPRLVLPTVAVRESFLEGERDLSREAGMPADGFDVAENDFASYVDERRKVGFRWGVPYTTFWYVSGEHYIGTLILRHRLTPELAEVGGHVGYHVVPRWRRQGHATRMLVAGLVECRRLGLSRVLLTCASDNEPSRRVILAGGGVPDGSSRGEDRFWIDLG
jgi:predicted acetyltransferase